jgi:cytochrome P450
MPQTIAFQGLPGAYSDLACRDAYPGWATLPCPSFEAAMDAVRSGAAELAMLPCSEWIEMLPIPAVKRFGRSRALLDAIIYRLIQERRDAGYREMGDLLSMLLAAQDEDGSRMSDQQVRDEALTLFVAGHETTALTLTWLFTLLDGRRDVLEAMREEVDRVLVGREPSFEDFPKLIYLRQVVDETLRLRGPVAMTQPRAVPPVTRQPA